MSATTTTAGNPNTTAVGGANAGAPRRLRLRPEGAEAVRRAHNMNMAALIPEQRQEIKDLDDLLKGAVDRLARQDRTIAAQKVRIEELEERARQAEAAGARQALLTTFKTLTAAAMRRLTKDDPDEQAAYEAIVEALKNSEHSGIFQLIKTLDDNARTTELQTDIVSMTRVWRLLTKDDEPLENHSKRKRTDTNVPAAKRARTPEAQSHPANWNRWEN